MQKITCVDIHGKEYQVGVSELRWRPSAYAVIIRDNSVLVSKQWDGYDLPGGGVDLGEMPEEAVIREVKEETGITASNPKILDAKSNLFKLPGEPGDCVQSILLFYHCDFLSGELSIDHFTEDDKKYTDWPEWIKLEELFSLDRFKIASSVDWRYLVKKVANI